MSSLFVSNAGWSGRAAACGLLASLAAPAACAQMLPAVEAVHLDAYVIQASPLARTSDELAQPTSVVAGQDLLRRQAPTLGETLDGLPGVASTAFGPGASRPIIRGLGGERIRVLANGLGSADASSLSPDHAVAFDPSLAQHVEILRGPATLLYGNAAIGGVVNVIDHRIPDEKPAAAVSGSIDASLGSAADLRAGSLGLRGAAGALVWQVSGAHRETGDLTIPGWADADHGQEEDDDAGELEEVEGVLANSSTRTTSGSAGFTWFGEKSRVGLATSGLDTTYGVPGHEHHHEGEVDGDEAEGHGHAGVTIELEQRRLDLDGAVSQPWAGFRGATYRVAATDYEHREMEGDEIGTRFSSEVVEGRVDLLQQPLGALEGAVGLQVSRATLAAEGEEAFIPSSKTVNTAVFAIEELVRGPMRWQAGARWEHQDIALRTSEGGGRADDALSASVGAVWSPAEAWSVALSLARSSRMPIVQELYADGPHAATRTYEIGDDTLGREASTGLDLSVRRRMGTVTGTVSAFWSRFEDYIFEAPTGSVEDGFDVYRFVAREVRYSGAEADITWHVVDRETGALHVTVQADAVRGDNRTDDVPLPRMPGRRLGLRVDGGAGAWRGGIEIMRTAAQDRVAPLETPSAGYTLVDAWIGYRVGLSRGALDIQLRASNLTDEEARPHTSFLREVAPLPGRDITLGVRWEF